MRFWEQIVHNSCDMWQITFVKHKHESYLREKMKYKVSYSKYPDDANIFTYGMDIRNELFKPSPLIYHTRDDNST